MKYNYSYFQNLYDENYKKSSFDPENRLRIERFKKIARYVKSGEKVLDFGGGNGDLVRYLPKDCSYTIADLSSEHKLDSFDRTLIKDDIYLDKADNFYDVIVLSEVLEHIPNCFETLSEVSRVLKPEGLLIITVPNPFAPLPILRSIFGQHQDPSKEHINWFDWSYLSNLLSSIGPRLVSKSTFCLVPSRIYLRLFFLDVIFTRILPHNGGQLFCVFKK